MGRGIGQSFRLKIIAEAGHIAVKRAGDTGGADERFGKLRPIAALKARGWLTRAQVGRDQRAEILTPTDSGCEGFPALGQKALAFDSARRAKFGCATAARIDAVPRRLIGLRDGLPEGGSPVATPRLRAFCPFGEKLTEHT